MYIAYNNSKTGSKMDTSPKIFNRKKLRKMEVKNAISKNILQSDASRFSSHSPCQKVLLSV